MGSIITSDLVPIEIRGTYQSYINIVYGAGSALGAATGGAIADSLGWRWEFGFQVPFLATCLLLGIITVPRSLGLREGSEIESFGTAMRKFDYKGSLLLTTSITSLILGLVGSPKGKGSDFVLISRRIWVETSIIGHIQSSYQ
jgi:MFS family permease